MFEMPSEGPRSLLLSGILLFYTKRLVLPWHELDIAKGTRGTSPQCICLDTRLSRLFKSTTALSLSLSH